MIYRKFVPILLLVAGMLSQVGAFADTPRSEPASDESSASSKDAEAVQVPPAPGPAAGDKIASPEEFEALAAVLEKAYSSAEQPESVRMLIAIARGSRMGPGEGWFGPAQSRYTWEWLARLHEIDPSKGISPEAFRGKAEMFPRLDRNKDGSITGDDLDWSDSNPYVQRSYMVNRLFRRLDQEGDGRVSLDELTAFFERLAGGRDSFRSEDLRDALIGGPSDFLPGDAPTPDMLVRGLFRGEIGSLNAGPNLDEPAPDFRLTTHDGSGTIRLGEQLGTKPVVLVFGNFTCGPFRSMYPMVDELFQRYQEQATFLAIYVREAHPTDGWHMESNSSVGVSVSQPTCFAERTAVAQQCHAKLKVSMPLLVDEIHDPVGNSYSGMPARLYVIDPEGKVAYKSGRGPFGFKSGEMEQALVMALLDRPSEDKLPVAGP